MMFEVYVAFCNNQVEMVIQGKYCLFMFVKKNYSIVR